MFLCVCTLWGCLGPSGASLVLLRSLLVCFRHLSGHSGAVSLGLACPDFGGLLWIAGCSCGCGYGCGWLGFVDVAGGVEIPEVLSVSMLDQV